MAKRRNIPLLELLGGAQQAPPARPQAKASTPARSSASSGPTELRLSILTASIAVVSVLVLLVVSWTVAYSLGYKDAENELLTSPPSEAGPAPTEPDTQSSTRGSDPSRSAGRSGNQGTPGVTNPNPGLAERPTARSRGDRSASVLVPQGSGLEDPRVVGSNYLELVILTRGQAQTAIDFLWSRSEQAIAVPVLEAGGSRANTSPRYRVIATGLAVPGGRFTASRAERERFERTIRSIGRSWLAEHSGASDFSSPLWKRYDP